MGDNGPVLVLKRKRQGREHLFKECPTWGREIRRLWHRVGEISGRRGGEDTPVKSRKGFGYQVHTSRARPDNTSIREVMADDRYVEAVLDILRETGVGRVAVGVDLKRTRGDGGRLRAP